MSNNKKAKQKLIERYGSIDFLDVLKKQQDEEHEIPIIFVDKIDLPFEIKITEIYIDKQGKINNKDHHSQQKRETQQMINVYMKGQNDYEK